jgi:hypothetical protein
MSSFFVTTQVHGSRVQVKGDLPAFPCSGGQVFIGSDIPVSYLSHRIVNPAVKCVGR